ncbi:histidine phosphatase superfamily [Polychytrium aggregatum]|uniref:histidine phosphatase superfamily n=1 Tax=Polychytrium aggregatum TaxID=110093 RepID=UPI0022FE6FCA|nr:histidine phosphatase superfamily [Polychytrium aggregatum]KAI9193411.1 histidine phosphatase superfamily [Polychytrium aggregatum]
MPFPILDEDSFQQLYGGHLKLKFAQIVFRHGERTPVSMEMTERLSPGLWRACQRKPNVAALGVHQESNPAVTMHPIDIDTIAFQPPFDSTGAPTTADMSAYTEIRNSVGRDDSPPGQLTDKGKASAYRLGSNLRLLYIERLGLVSSTLKKGYEQELYLRSSDMLRTIESAQYLLSGMYPQHYRATGSSQASVQLHVQGVENMYPRLRDSRIQTLMAKLIREATEANMAEISQALACFSELGVDALSPRFGKTYGLYDYLYCMRGDGMDLPAGVTEQDLEDLEKALIKMWASPVFTNHEMVSITSGSYFQQLKAQIAARISGKNELGLALYSAHDTTILSLLNSLGLEQPSLPPFASVVVIELLENTHKSLLSAEYYIRVSYNGHHLSFPASRLSLSVLHRDARLCTVEDFFSKLDSFDPSGTQHGHAALFSRMFPNV